MRTIESKITLFAIFLIIALEQTLSFCEIFSSQLLLYSHQTLYKGLVFFIHLVFTTLYRTRDNERSTCIVNEHRVYLVDNSIIMLALYKVGGTHGHVVTKVVKTKFVVSTKSNVAIVCTTASFTVGLVLVDAVHAQPMELIERSHPFRVTFGEVVIDSHHVHTTT